LSSDERKIHDLVYALRDKHYGHCASNLETFRTCVWLNPIERGGRAVNSVSPEVHYLSAPRPELFLALSKGIETLVHWIESEIGKEQDELKHLVEKCFTLDQLYAGNAKPPPLMRFAELLPKKRKP
jgi:hypothetical protein